MALNCKQVIQFTNVTNCETFTFSLIFVKGIININVSNESENLVVYYLKNNNIIKKISSRIHHCKFIVLLHLEPGRNEFVFNIQKNMVKKTFFYVLSAQTFVVTPVYIICADDNESNLTNETIKSICDKISFGCKLLQTLVAETISYCGFGKKTFILENG